MRHFSAWVLVSVLVSGCGLSVGVRSTDSAGPAETGLMVVSVGDVGERQSTTSPPTSAAEDEQPVAGGPDDAPQPGDDTAFPTTGGTAEGPDTDAASTTSAGPTSSTPATTVADTSTSAPPSEPEPASTIFFEDEVDITHICDGNGVTISGDAGDYTLEGSCGTVTITGSFNTVFIEEVSVLDLTGTLNAVVYNSGDPVVTDQDGENIVTAG